jgi:hypothetical protein
MADPINTQGQTSATNPPPPPPDAGPPQQPADVQTGMTAPPPTPPPPQPGDVPNLPQPTQPKVVYSDKKPGLMGVLDEVFDWVAGKQGTRVAYDDAGNRYVEHPVLTRGQQWAKLGEEAFRGAAAGAAARTKGAALFTGAQASAEAQEKQEKQQAEDADKNAAVARQTRMDAANDHIRDLQRAELTFRLDREKQEASEQDQKFSMEMRDTYENKLGGRLLGNYNTDNFTDVIKDHPDFAKWAIDPKQVFMVPHMQDGKRQGNDFYFVPQDQMKKIVPPDEKFPRYVAPKDMSDPKARGTVEYYTPSDPQTYADKARAESTVGLELAKEQDRIGKYYQNETAAITAAYAKPKTEAEIDELHARAQAYRDERGRQAQNRMDTQTYKEYLVDDKEVSTLWNSAQQQQDNIGMAKTELNSGAEGQALGTIKTIVALAGGKSSGVRVTMPELNSIATARGIKGGIEGFINQLSGQGKYSDEQIQQLNGILDDAAANVGKKQTNYFNTLRDLSAADNPTQLRQVMNNYRAQSMGLSATTPAPGAPTAPGTPAAPGTAQPTLIPGANDFWGKQQMAPK